MGLFSSTKQNTDVTSVNKNTINVDAATSVTVDTTAQASAITDIFDRGSEMLGEFFNAFTNGASLAANNLSKGIGGAGANIGFGVGIIGLSILLARK